PSRSTARNVTRQPRLSRSWQGRRTALCSTAVVTTRPPWWIRPVANFPPLSDCPAFVAATAEQANAEWIATLFDSVPPLVKTISDVSHPSNAARRSRASSTAFRDFAAKAYPLEGLP